MNVVLGDHGLNFQGQTFKTLISPKQEASIIMHAMTFIEVDIHHTIGPL